MQHILNEFPIELENRRRRLLDEMPLSSIAILKAESTQLRNGDAEYPFRQGSNFYYLTGFCEPDAVMVLTKDAEGSSEFILFCQSSNLEEELWTGPRAGLAGARQQFGATKSYDIEILDDRIPKLLNNKTYFLYSLGVNPNFDTQMAAWVNLIRSKGRKGGNIPKMWIDLNAIVHSHRLKKSPYEIALMREAAGISARAHIRLMQSCRPGKMEYYLEAEFLYACYSVGARAMAYTPIVGAGQNACVLHYTQNNKPLNPGELVLVDAGCEYEYYAADITRTFPVNGKFTEPQKAIYELVLRSQLAAIELIKPGASWNSLQDKIVQVLVEGLVSLGLLVGKADTLIADQAYRKFYMHSSGHWLGLDVHDVGDYRVGEQWTPLEAGMVLTVEPGLYISANQPEVDKQWWGIGVRIEDDILVTESGYEVLSHQAPKTIDAIEQLMKASDTVF
jgi:Xaa-Pro aminopeptidase